MPLMPLPNWDKRRAKLWRHFKRGGYGGGVRQFLRDYNFQCIQCGHPITRIEMRHLGLCAICKTSLRTVGQVRLGAGCSIQRISDGVAAASPLESPTTAMATPAPVAPTDPDVSATAATQFKLPGIG